MSTYYELTVDDLSMQSPNNEEYANLFGIRALEGLGCFPFCPQKFSRENKKRVEREFNVGIAKGASCADIDIELKRIENELNAIRGKIAGGEKQRYWTQAVGVLEARKKDALNRKESAQCEQKKAEQERQREQQENVKILEQTAKSAVSVDPVEAALQAAAPKKTDPTLMIALGVGGIMLVGAVVLLLKR
jgi:hypothetical protein